MAEIKFSVLLGPALTDVEKKQAIHMFRSAEKWEALDKASGLLGTDEWFVVVTKLCCPVKSYVNDLQEVMREGHSCSLSQCNEVCVVKACNIKLDDGTVTFDLDKDAQRILFVPKDKSNKVEHAALLDPSVPVEYVQVLNLYDQGYDKLLNKAIPYKALDLVVKEKMTQPRRFAYHVLATDATQVVANPNAAPTHHRLSLVATGTNIATILASCLFFEHVVMTSDPSQPVPYDKLDAAHEHYPVCRIGPVISMKAAYAMRAAHMLARRSSEPPGYDQVFDTMLEVASKLKRDLVFGMPADGDDKSITLQDLEMHLDAAMAVKDLELAITIIDALIRLNTTASAIPSLYTKKISLHFMVGSDDKRFEKELTTIITGSTDPELLQMLALLVMTSSNDSVKEMMCEKVMRNATTTTVDGTAIMCLKTALALRTVKAQTIATAMDLIEVLNDKMNAATKKTCTTLVFQQITNNGHTDLH